MADLVVGDIIEIDTWMRVPADCILIESMDLVCDESMYPEGSSSAIKMHSLGEVHHFENSDPFLLGLSLVVAGKGRAVVCAVGQHKR